MTREEFKNIVKARRAAYTNPPIDSQAVFDLWYEMLKDASYEDVSRTLENHIKANKFAPTIAELRAGTEHRNRFNNFLPRGYDFDKLEAALLEVDNKAIEEKRNLIENQADKPECLV